MIFSSRLKVLVKLWCSFTNLSFRRAMFVFGYFYCTCLLVLFIVFSLFSCIYYPPFNSDHKMFFFIMSSMFIAMNYNSSSSGKYCLIFKRERARIWFYYDNYNRTHSWFDKSWSTKKCIVQMNTIFCSMMISFLCSNTELSSIVHKKNLKFYSNSKGKMFNRFFFLSILKTHKNNGQMMMLNFWFYIFSKIKWKAFYTEIFWYLKKLK